MKKTLLFFLTINLTILVACKKDDSHVRLDFEGKWAVTYSSPLFFWINDAWVDINNVPEAAFKIPTDWTPQTQYSWEFTDSTYVRYSPNSIIYGHFTKEGKVVYTFYGGHQAEIKINVNPDKKTGVIIETRDQDLHFLEPTKSKAIQLVKKID